MILSSREKVLMFTVCVILLISWSISCSSIGREDNEWWKKRISYNVIEDNNTLEEVWTRSDIFIRDRGGRCLPFMTAYQKKVFVIGNIDHPDSKAVLAIDAINGQLIWQTDNPDGFQHTGLYAISSFLYSGSGGNATLRAYDVDKGEIVWTKALSGRFVDCFRIIDNLIFVETNSNLQFVHADTGEILHNFDDLPTEEELLQLISQLGISVTTQLKPEYFSDAILNGNVFIKKKRIFDRQTGELLWEFEGDVISNIAVTSSNVYLLTKDRRLLGLDVRSGEVTASVQFEPIPTTLGSHGYDNAFYVAVDEQIGMVYAFLGDGAQLFAFRITKQ